MRQVERAIFDLRRGLPVVLRTPQDDVLIQPLEGIDDTALSALADMAGHAPGLVITTHRLASLGTHAPEGADAVRLPLGTHHRASDVVAWAMAAMAEPPGIQPPAPASAAETAALNLMRRGQLVPAALSARVDATRREAMAALIDDGTLLGVALDDVQRYGEGDTTTLKRISEANVPLADAEQARFVLFRESDGLREHLAVLVGDPTEWADAVPVRLHSACLTGDLFGSLRCDCGEQLRTSVAAISEHGGGILLYLAQEGRGIGLANKLRAYGLQDTGLDTVDADQVLGFGEDERQYRAALQMLAELAVTRIALLTNNPEKIAAMSLGGIDVMGREACYGKLNEHNRRYLSAKAERAGHWLEDVLESRDVSDRHALHRDTSGSLE
ncbi:GTP cyclohydrolase II [Chromohalobacter nigrandesensis]|uniref:GTP cyclohydrolase II n=1 Tax=Chromohalobacter nigrandesensis TaxID=119863 RepID=UPI001FF2D4DA|nr:GTP cyclohydrolase II [Chromohalobacter nigrandesensis]MCK0744172.1 GTP cyclohydrolase II [Chromohalobacter nigrandesensis]